MTVFIASLFLPKTIHFTLPGTPPRGSHSEKKQPGKPKTEDQQPSLFQTTDITPPQTPTDDKPLRDPFANEDGLRVHIPPEPGSGSLRAPADRSSPTWGGRPDQPMSRANSPPPPSLVDKGRNLLHKKAREMGLQGITQPRSLARSDSHDRVFAHANWKVVNADQGNGGLRNAAEAAAREGKLGEYTWVGTLGMPTDALQGTQQLQDIEDKLATEHDMLTVFCSDKDFDGHYSHFCKQILWPVFHYQIPDNPKSKAYEDHSWKYYVNVNQAFADKIVKNWKRGDSIWIHDYHLLLVPQMIRKKIPDAKIGFFLHVAFPSSEVFRCVAVRKQLLEGMLGANLIGFQIHEYTRHFLQTCSRLLSAEATPEGLQLEDRFVDVINLPIGIDPVSLSRHREEDEVKRWLDIMRERYAGKKLIVARDKLDHVRGVRQKLLSYELFLNKNPEWRDKIVLIQVALSTSEKSELDATVSDIVTRVNSSWANLAYQPVVYLKQDIDYAQYLALLSIADALMITSQREGMNLTSHEYLYCQDGKISEKKHGSLILSEFTGTSSLFGGNELSVNPWDYRACAEAIKKALEMDDEEKERRWTKLYEAVNHHTGSHWFTELMSRLDHVYEEQHRRDQTAVPRLSMNTLLQQYNRSGRRLFILDFEGTLVSWGPVNQIIPVSPQRTVDVLNDLLIDERNTIYVMSGRRKEELDHIFRRVPNLGLIAENGCFLKDCGSSDWQSLADDAQIRSWKESVKGILTYYLERTPGAEIEERRCSLMFHYKSAEDYEAAMRQATDCASHINDACEAQRVHAIPLDGCVLVEPIDWTKSTAAQKIFADLRGRMEPDQKHHSPVDFLMVVGDGREDEKVFKWANTLGEEGVVKDVVTVSLGSRNTEATATLTQGVSGELLPIWSALCIAVVQIGVTDPRWFGNRRAYGTAEIGIHRVSIGSVWLACLLAWLWSTTAAASSSAIHDTDINSRDADPESQLAIAGRAPCASRPGRVTLGDDDTLSRFLLPIDFIPFPDRLKCVVGLTLQLFYLVWLVFFFFFFSSFFAAPHDTPPSFVLTDGRGRLLHPRERNGSSSFLLCLHPTFLHFPFNNPFPPPSRRFFVLTGRTPRVCAAGPLAEVHDASRGMDGKGLTLRLLRLGIQGFRRELLEGW